MHHYRRTRFSLATFLRFVLIAGVIAGCVGIRFRDYLTNAAAQRAQLLLARQYQSIGLSARFDANGNVTELRRFGVWLSNGSVQYGPTDTQLGAMAIGPTVELLDLSHASVSDESVVILRKLSGIEELNLIDTSVTPAGIKSLRETLGARTTIYYRASDGINCTEESTQIDVRVR